MAENRECKNVSEASASSPSSPAADCCATGSCSGGDQTRLSRAGLMDLVGRANVSPLRPHLFWDTQPVPKMSEVVSEAMSEPIDLPKGVEDVKQEPYKLPSGYEWCVLNIAEKSQLNQVYELLDQNYVEDDDNMFRFCYSHDFLKWALCPPEYVSNWHVGVRASVSQKLVGFITGIPARVNVRGKELSIAEINFLCVHKKLRTKRLAPVLIKEITRRVNLTDRWQAVYTAGITLPKPVSRARYWHRSLQPKKLIEIGFSSLGKRMTISRAIRLYKLPDTHQLKGIRPMELRDVPAVSKILKEHLQQYHLHPELTEEEVFHWIAPKPDIVCSYVRETEGKVTDLLSFYLLPSTIIGNEKYKTLRAAYAYYNVANTCTLVELINEALIAAKTAGCDVYNALDVMKNSSMLEDLKFGIGDGFLQYYIYNWRCAEMASSEVGLVLL